MTTVVIQSFRTEDVPAWISSCLESVRSWTDEKGYAYRFVGDEIFDMVPARYRENAGHRPPVITDLGRLLLIQGALADGAERAIWLDADVLVFDPARLSFDDDPAYAFGREFWVQPGPDGGLRVYRNVHNAVSLFRRENPFLEFYVHACERIVRAASGSVPNQVVGTKFLTALHNIMGFDLIETVGMLSPLVNGDIAAGGGPALERLRAVSPRPLAAANLCSSLAGGEADGVSLTDELMGEVCGRLLDVGGLPE